MPKRTVFTNITPLPPHTTLEIALATLQNHDEMIELNPFVIEHHPIKPPRDAATDEFLDCDWQEITDEVNFLPGGIAKGKVRYKACFHNLPNGLQTHVYASLGVDIREKWTICGNPNGRPNNQELGLNIPPSGLYIREEGDIKCSAFLASFVRKNLDCSHRTLVERIMQKVCQMPIQHSAMETTSSCITTTHRSLVPPKQQLASRSAPELPMIHSEHRSGAQQDAFPTMQEIHPAFRDDTYRIIDEPEILASPLPAYQSLDRQQTQFYKNDLAKRPAPREMTAELEGSSSRTPHSTSSSFSNPGLDYRYSKDSKFSQPRTPTDYFQSLQQVVIVDNIPNRNDLKEEDQPMSARSDLSYTVGATNRFSSISSMPTPPLESQASEHRHSVVSSISASSTPGMGQSRFRD